MSYDVYIEAVREVEVFWDNHTSNCAEMWREAGCDLAELQGVTAAEALPRLRAAVAAMEAEPERFRPMEPANGWGSYESALDFLRRFADACEVDPDGRLRISY